jgi:hypothetical protein
MFARLNSGQRQERKMAISGNIFKAPASIAPASIAIVLASFAASFALPASAQADRWYLVLFENGEMLGKAQGGRAGQVYRSATQSGTCKDGSAEETLRLCDGNTYYICGSIYRQLRGWDRNGRYYILYNRNTGQRACRNTAKNLRPVAPYYPPASGVSPLD